VINSTQKALTVFILAFLSVGCFPHFFTYTDIELKDCVTNDPNLIWHIIDPESQLTEEQNNHVQPTREDILKIIGDPDKIIAIDATTSEWQYNEKSWCGTRVSYLPFILPVCDGYVRIHLQEGITRKVFYTRKSISEGDFIFFDQFNAEENCFVDPDPDSIALDVELRMIKNSKMNNFRTTASETTLMSTPSERRSKVKAIVERETLLEPLRESHNWVEVKTPNGDVGWIKKAKFEEVVEQ